MTEQLPRINSKARELVQKKVEESRATYQKYVEFVDSDKSDTFKGTKFEELYKGFSDNLRDSDYKKNDLRISLVKEAITIKDAETVNDNLKKVLSSLDNDEMMLDSYKADIERNIKGLELRIRIAGNPDKKEDDTALKKDLEAAKTFLNMLGQFGRIHEKAYEDASSLSSTLAKLFSI